MTPLCDGSRAVRRARRVCGSAALFLAILKIAVWAPATAAPRGSDGPELHLVPRPASLQIRDGEFEFEKNTVLAFDHEDPRVTSAAVFLAERLRAGTGLPMAELQVSSRQGVMMFDNDRTDGDFIGLILISDEQYGPEGYRMVVNEGNVLIGANTAAGLFYGVMTFLQLLPPEVFGEVRPGEKAPDVEWKIPCVSITDAPRFPWRGMHLDVARHFFPKEAVKRYIDLLALHKMNIFHWHLTDDQGWRIEIRKYPRLTEVGAWRNGSMVGPYSDMKFDSIPYGGFYTQEEIREVVQYAARQNVTIVPEIELPGHALAALASYPELSCTGGPFEVGKAWGVYEDIFCPKETTFTFLENVLSEVCNLFPGQYVHIGGDEAPKVRWMACDSCKARMASLGLKTGEELQSWFVTRIEKFLNSKGKRVIGWDEILEGGLAPNAAVMSWRGTDGGIAAARAGHYAVMTPGSNCYFDHYQGNPKYEPLAIGGFTPLDKVYSYEPVPPGLSPREEEFILGAQGNLWTEYITTPKQVEYMAAPRIAALSEVVWSPASTRSWDYFLKRLVGHLRVLDVMNVNYSKSLYQLQTSTRPSPDGAGILYELAAPLPGGTIRYTTDGTEPVKGSKEYNGAIPVTKPGTVKSAYFVDGAMVGPAIAQEFTVSRSTGKTASLRTQPHRNYPGIGAATLTDGIRGDFARYGKDWIGFQGPSLDAVVDLGAPTPVSTVTIDVFLGEGSWIHPPKSIEVLLSDDGASFTSAGKLSAESIAASGNVQTVSFAQRNARYVRVVAAGAGKIPDGKPGAGQDAWLMVDEIIVQ